MGRTYPLTPGLPKRAKRTPLIPRFADTNDSLSAERVIQQIKQVGIRFVIALPDRTASEHLLKVLIKDLTYRSSRSVIRTQECPSAAVFIWLATGPSLSCNTPVTRCRHGGKEPCLHDGGVVK